MKDRFFNIPLIYIARMLWRNAEARRGHLLLHLRLSAGSMVFWLTTPLVVARLVNTAQAAAYDRQLRDCLVQTTPCISVRRGFTRAGNDSL